MLSIFYYVSTTLRAYPINWSWDHTGCMHCPWTYYCNPYTCSSPTPYCFIVYGCWYNTTLSPTSPSSPSPSSATHSRTTTSTYSPTPPSLSSPSQPISTPTVCELVWQGHAIVHCDCAGCPSHTDVDWFWCIVHCCCRCSTFICYSFSRVWWWPHWYFSSFMDASWWWSWHMIFDSLPHTHTTIPIIYRTILLTPPIWYYLVTIRSLSSTTYSWSAYSSNSSHS